MTIHTHEPRLIAGEITLTLSLDGVHFQPTDEPNVLGTLIWALEAEEAFNLVEGTGGDAGLLQMAKFWCGLISKYGDTGEDRADLDIEVLHDALFAASLLAPTADIREMVYEGYFTRMRKMVMAKMPAGYTQGS